MSPSAAHLGATGSCSLLYGKVLVAEEVDEIGEKWSGDNTTVNVETLLEVFWENFRLGTFLRNCQSIRISRVLTSGLKGFYCLHMSVCIMVTDINMPG
jgi:hypothetical protein